MHAAFLILSAISKPGTDTLPVCFLPMALVCGFETRVTPDTFDNAMTLRFATRQNSPPVARAVVRIKRMNILVPAESPDKPDPPLTFTHLSDLLSLRSPARGILCSGAGARRKQGQSARAVPDVSPRAFIAPRDKGSTCE